MEKDKHAQSTAAASPSTTPSAESGSQQHESVNAASTSGTGSGVDAGKVNATPDGVVIPTIQEPVSNQMLMLAMDNLRLEIKNFVIEAIVASEKGIRAEMRDMEARLGAKMWQFTGLIIAAFTLASVLK